jgi:hypothetical protein
MRRMTPAFALVLIASLSVRGVAQQEKGDKEVQIFGNVSTTTASGGGGGSSSTGSVGGFIGYFLTRQLQLKGGMIVDLSSTSGQTQATGVLSAGVVFNFATEGRKTFPYVGVDILSIGTSEPNSQPITAYRPAAGFKTFFTRNAAFDLNVGIEQMTGQQAQNAGTTVDSRFGLAFVF